MNGDYSNANANANANTNANTNTNANADEDHCDSLFDRQFLEDDLAELMLENEAQFVRGTPDMAFYAWDCNGVKEDDSYAERNVPMGGEVVAFARDGRICTTGIATCVAIAVRAYSIEGDLVFDYLKHDPEFASATLDDKLRTLYDGLRAIRDWCDENPCGEIGSFKLFVAGGQPDPDLEDTTREDAQTIKRAMKPYRVSLKYYNITMNMPPPPGHMDGSSLTVVLAEDKVWVVLNTDMYHAAEDGANAKTIKARVRNAAAGSGSGNNALNAQNAQNVRVVGKKKRKVPNSQTDANDNAVATKAGR